MTKYLDENGLLYLWGKLKATFLHNASEGRFTGVSTNTSTGLRTFNVPTIAEHIYYDSNKNSTLKDKIDTIVSQGGEPNTIETVKVNGTALVPDANKAVNITFTDNDTKNTAGSTNSNSKLYLIGATSQAANPQTYSRAAVYVGTDGKLRSGFGVNSATDAQSIVATASDLSGYLPLTGGTITGSLTVNNGITIPTGSLHVQYGDLHVDKIVHNIDPNDQSATKFWATNGTIQDLSTSLSGYLPLSGGTMAQSGPINFDTGGYIQYDSTTTGIKMVSPETITITGTEGIQINTGNSNDIKLEGAREILLSGSQTTIYSDLYMRDGGVIAYDSADRSNTEVWNTNGGTVDLTTYAPLASPALTGTPTAPTATAGTNTTQIATTQFVTTAVNNAIGGVTGITYEVVQTLPASGSAGTIYLISNSGTNPNIYDEYIYVNNGFEKIGTTDVDLTGYWSKTELVVIPNTTIDYIVANNALPTT